MIKLNVLDETSPLEAVVLGTPVSFGPRPTVQEAYDPKSISHIKANTYPKEEAMLPEMEAFREVLEKHRVAVYRPTEIKDFNQVFARDIGIVIGERFVVPQILDKRKREQEGLADILKEIDPDKVVRAAPGQRLEGGDVMPIHGKILVGYSKKPDFDKYTVSRTNEAGVEFLMDNFPDWEVVAFELNKSDSDPFKNALHLDCCFQPVGRDMAILYPGGFKYHQDVDYLTELYGKDKIIEIDQEEMYQMTSNIFSIAPDVVVSDSSFHRLNDILRNHNILVEEIAYREIAKMEGLLRCSTLPLRRRYA